MSAAAAELERHLRELAQAAAACLDSFDAGDLWGLERDLADASEAAAAGGLALERVRGELDGPPDAA